jgi:hypothetical protein
MRFGTLLVGVVVCLSASQTRAADAPDFILHHGQVLTVDAQFRIAEAVAVKGERITAVGSNDEIQKLAGASTQVIDLKGQMVLPGLCDSHTHPTGAAMHEWDHAIPDMETIADVLDYIRQRTAVVAEGDWIVVRQVFVTRLRDQRFPTRKELDLVAPKHPVLFSTGPDAAANSLALSLSKIDKDTKITDGQPGYLERDPQTGELTGILRSCTRLVKPKAKEKPASADEQRTRLKELLSAYNAVGLTSIADRSASDGAVKLFDELREQNQLTCRMFLSYGVNAQDPIDQIEARIVKASKHKLHDYNHWVWLRGVKIFLDGGMLTGSAYMRQPWGVSSIYSITDPEYRGLKYVEPDKLQKIAHLALANDLQMTAHSVGDGAVHALIDAYEAVNKTLPVKERRPCITHCNFMSLEAIQKMRALGIVADLQPAWLFLDGATLRKQFGDSRTEYFQPYKTIFEQGVVVGGGSDHMQKLGSLRSINPYDPWLGIWTTLTRQPRWTDEPLHPEQRISRTEALRLYTINNAYLTFEEKEKGSLEAGKLADFIVIDRDYLKCPEAEIRDIKVQQTWVGGKRVWQR